MTAIPFDYIYFIILIVIILLIVLYKNNSNTWNIVKDSVLCKRILHVIIIIIVYITQSIHGVNSYQKC